MGRYNFTVEVDIDIHDGLEHGVAIYRMRKIIDFRSIQNDLYCCDNNNYSR